jgi:hypothetical protein
MKTKALQEGVLKGATFTNKINYSLINVLNTLARVPKMDRQSKASNNYQTNKGRRRGVTPKCLPSNGRISLQWIDLVSL